MLLNNYKGNNVIDNTGHLFGKIKNFEFKNGVDSFLITRKDHKKNVKAIVKSHDDSGNIILSPVLTELGDLIVVNKKK